MTTPVAAHTVLTSRLLVCFSHLRWAFVQQRPQHLLGRAAKEYRVFYVEEPTFEAGGAAARLDVREDALGVAVVTPRLPEGAAPSAVRGMLDALIAATPHEALLTWYYTPMALAFSDHLRPEVCVYDCMDELSAFQDPPPGLRENEDRLFARADLVFTGGYSLFEAKRGSHDAVFAFPSSVDAAHFAAARRGRPDPADQSAIPHPRIGFFGVIDERMDLDLVAHAARTVPEASFVMLGPVVKIDPASLPSAPNLHWLGPKRYDELPDYLANWAAGWMPFAINAATRFISPTKTPEFLAAGLPVTSTAVPDVVRGYGDDGLVVIADAGSITTALRASLAPPHPAWRTKVEDRLAAQSWDHTWAEMRDHIRRVEAEIAPLQRKGA